MMVFGSLWEQTVTSLLHLYGGSEQLLFVTMFSLASGGTFYLVNAFLWICYRFDLFPEKRIQ